MRTPGPRKIPILRRGKPIPRESVGAGDTRACVTGVSPCRFSSVPEIGALTYSIDFNVSNLTLPSNCRRYNWKPGMLYMMRRDFDRLDLLSELSRKTTAYHDATVDRIEDARAEYLEALRSFNSARDAEAFDDGSGPELGGAWE